MECYWFPVKILIHAYNSVGLVMSNEDVEKLELHLKENMQKLV